jgi:nucleoside 2-deoxyribosyltransferase
MPFIEKSGAYSTGFFTEVLNSLVIPAGREAGFEVKTANRQGTEMIHSTIVNEILDADMCVCDLTEHNPNVLFELGIRLGHDKPVALIQAEGTARVFDVDNVLRVLAYKKELWRTTIQKDLPELTAHIRATWENRETSESYYKLLRSSKPDKKAKSMSASA